MKGFDYDTIIVSFGNQKFLYSSNNFKVNNKYIGKVFNNYHYEYKSNFEHLFYICQIHDVKYFVCDDEKIIYCLISFFGSTKVNEVNNNFLIDESYIDFKYFYIEFKKNSLNELLNTNYDKNKFKLILYYDYPNIYDFEENDIKLDKNNHNSLLIFEKNDKIYINELINLATNFKSFKFSISNE